MSYKTPATGCPVVVSAGLPIEVLAVLAEALPDVGWTGAADWPELLEAASRPEARLVLLDESALAPNLEDRLLELKRARVPPIFLCLGGDQLRQGDLPRRLIRAGVSRLFHNPLKAPEMARQLAFQLGVPLKRMGVPKTQAEVETITALAKLWNRFRAANLDRVRVLARAGQAAQAGSLDLPLVEWARREAHKLIGSAGTYGFPTASLLAREAEGLLGQAEVNGERLVALSERIEHELEGIPGGSAVGSPARELPCLALVTRDERLGEELAWAAPRFRLACQVVAAPSALGPEHPDAIVVDVSGISLLEERVAIHRELCHRHPGVPLVVLTSHDNLETRLAATELGGHRVLHKSGSLDHGVLSRSDLAHLTSKILEEVKNLLETRRRQVFRILAVDDDPSALAGVEVVLRPLGCKVTGVCDPLEFWHLLEVTSPDLVMLDVDMPGISGIDLCRALRTDPRWHECPVLFLTSYIDSGTVLELFDAGADDYVSKPIVAPELSARVRNRLTRSQFRASSGPQSLNERRRSRLEAEHCLREAERRLEVVGLARVALEIPDDRDYVEILRDFPARWRRLMGDHSLVACWGAAEFLLVAPEQTKGQVLKTLSQIQSELSRQHRTGMRAGAAHYPQDGRDFDSLLNAAEAALHQARTEERLRLVAWTDQQQTPPDSPDILLVEDDQTMVEMLVQSCEARGYRMAWVEGGKAALEALETGRIKPRVLLLDEDLPGLSGLQLMRQLVESGRLGAPGAPRVILLSDKLDEGQVRWALEHGAFDYMPKPFYLAALMRRLELALGV